MSGKRISVFTLSNAITSAVYLLVAVAVVLFVNAHHERYMLKEAELRALRIIDQNLSIHSYFSEELKPSVFGLTDRYRDKDYFDPAWMSSTYAVREINRRFQNINQEKDYYYKEIAISARSPENEADPFERDFLVELNRDPELTASSGVRDIDGKPFFYVMKRGEKLEAGCLRCHSAPGAAPAGLVMKYGAERSFHRTTGDTVSAISVRVPLEAARAETRGEVMRLSAVFVAALGVIFMVQYAVGRRLVTAPLNRIREKAVEISASTAHLQEPIKLPRGRELADLAAAFNRMASHLNEAMEGLERKVRNRTAELEELNSRLEDDIEARKLTEEALSATVKEKEMLVREVHHRVKNNFAVIQSLLRLQSRSVEDESLRGYLKESENRVRAMSMIHERLYRAKDLIGINTAEYIDTLSRNIAESFDAGHESVRLEVSADDVVMDIVTMVPCGLILNELVTNAFKHAFPEGATGGEVRVAFKALGGGDYALTVSDNGPGLPARFEIDMSESLGMRLVKMLTSQIDGTLDIHTDGGTSITIHFHDRGLPA